MKIGIVGGIGPESTIDYYKKIISGYRKIITDGSYPEIIINSIDMYKMITIMERKAWGELCEALSGAIKALKNAGADIAVIASNTPHVMFDKIKDLSPLRLISIVEVTAEKAFEIGCRKVVLLGTGFTMREHFYQDVLQRYGIETVVPSAEQQDYIHQKLFSEIELGIINDETRRELVKIVQTLENQYEIDGLILGCTELPLIIGQKDFTIPVVDTVEVHVQKVIEVMTNNL
jgi:aspartate racemase